MRWLAGGARGPHAADASAPVTPGLEQLEHELHRDVHALAVEIGERHLGRHRALQRAAELVEQRFAQAGLGDPDRQRYSVDGLECRNVAVEIPGRSDPGRVVVVGAHYDSAMGSPGANDNATGVATLFALARQLAADAPPAATVRLVAFTNEEVPHHREHTMGSMRYACRCREREERIDAMLCLETMGYYSDAPGSQDYPLPMGPFYPKRGSFLGFVGNLGSQGLVRRTVRSFRRHTDFPARAAILPSWVPGVSWSDHASFWAQGYRALMITDTAPFRYPHYHRPTDTPDKVDYPRLARVVQGLLGVVRDV